MDEKAKEKALKYMANLVEKTPPPTKFAISLPESREMTEGMLLGMYGAQVKYRDMDFILDDATVSKVEKVVRWMYDSRKRGLLLCGTLGNGKTTMLRSLKKLFGFNAVYYEAQSIYNHFKQSQTFPDISQNAVLLIDDLGVEPPTYNDFGEIRYPLAEFLMIRYKHNLPTVIATNCTFEQLGERYGDRLQDRMKEMYAMISYKEPSYRK